MESQELRKLRIAHGLTPSQLAEMLNASSQDVLCWEAPSGSPHHRLIDPQTRREILRRLAIWRNRQRESDLRAAAHANRNRFAAQPFVQTLVRVAR